jgi:hypothetical protein
MLLWLVSLIVADENVQYFSETNGLHIERTDIFATPLNINASFGGFVGGKEVGYPDWAIGNTCPYSSPTRGLVFSLYNEGWQESMRISNDGYMGIGTMNPEQRLHVSDGSILIENNHELKSKDTEGTTRTLLRLNSDNNLEMWNLAGDILVDCGGNVGIGTTEPSRTLQ